MYLKCVISKCVTTTTPTRIRTPPAPVSGFVTTPAWIDTPPAPVSGIQQLIV